MKIRIGIGVGRTSPEPDELVAIGSALAALGFDSIWLSEVLSGAGLDPLVALSFLAASVPELRLGTTMLLPGRNPARLAKSLASLDRLSGGKLLVTFVPGLNEGVERNAVGVAPRLRGEAIDQLLPLVRRLLAGEPVDYESDAGAVEGLEILPRPVQDPLEFWLGGSGPRALERCGRLGDGWLPSRCAPEVALAGRRVIEDVASAEGRSIDPEHFGISLQYARAPLSDADERALARLSVTRDSAPPPPVGRDELRRTIEEFVSVGVTKFVLRPVSTPSSWPEELEALAQEIGDLQT